MVKISIVVGDWSGDGHDKTENTLIESNLIQEDLLEAFKIGTERIGFDLTKCCTDYEDNDVTEHIEQIKPLFDNSITLMEEHGIEESYRTPGNWIVYSYGYLEIYLRICKLGNPQFEYTKAEEDDSIQIGGYGLFE